MFKFSPNVPDWVEVNVVCKPLCWIQCWMPSQTPIVINHEQDKKWRFTHFYSIRRLIKTKLNRELNTWTSPSVRWEPHKGWSQDVQLDIWGNGMLSILLSEKTNSVPVQHWGCYYVEREKFVQPAVSKQFETWCRDEEIQLSYLRSGQLAYCLICNFGQSLWFWILVCPLFALTFNNHQVK